MSDIFERIVNKNINLIKYNFKTKIHNINILYYIILYLIIIMSEKNNSPPVHIEK